MKKVRNLIFLSLFFILFYITSYSIYAKGVLPGSLSTENGSYHENLMKVILDSLSSGVTGGTIGNCTLQGGTGNDHCPIQNGCKLVQDKDLLKEKGLLTTCSNDKKEVLPGDIGIFGSNKNSQEIRCVYKVEDDILKAGLPKIETKVIGDCEGHNCKGVEPWYNTGDNNAVNIGIKLIPNSININGEVFINSLRLDTLKVFVNSSPIIYNFGETITNNPKTLNFEIDGSGGEKGKKGLNFISIEICDNVYDDNFEQVSKNEKYKLNCVSENFVVKIDPSTKEDASDDFALNQKRVKCSDYGYNIPENAEWEFPVQLNGSFIQNCDKQGYNCTPKAKNICNFICSKGSIRDGQTCKVKKKLMNCKDELGELGENEEWILPDRISSMGQFYASYNLEQHEYIPNLSYCEKDCKNGYGKAEDGTCKGLTRINTCKKEEHNIGHFKRYKIEYILPENEASANLDFQQIWEDKPEEDGFYNGIIQEKEYIPTITESCKLLLIDNIITDFGKQYCKEGYVPFDRNNDGIIGECRKIKPIKDGKQECYYFDVFEEGVTPYEKYIQAGGKNSKDLFFTDFRELEVKDIKEVETFYGKGKIPVCNIVIPTS